MAARDRENIILETLQAQGKLAVPEMQKILGVSDMTVRRLLNSMAERGLLRRVHGGAVQAGGASGPEAAAAAKEPRFPRRDTGTAIETGAIARLAREAITLIPPYGSIYLGGGAVCLEIARQLHPGVKCMVVTDHIEVCRELRGRPLVETLLLGGQLSVDGDTVEGSLTAENASKMTVSVFFFTAAAFTTSYLENAGVAGTLTMRTIMEKARKSVCVCDSGKLGKSRFMRFCYWREVDCFVTDDNLPFDARDAIMAEGVDVRLVGYSGERHYGRKHE